MLTLETIVEIRVHLPLVVLRKSNDEIQHYPPRRSLCLYLSSAHVYSCVSFSASPDREWQAMTNGKVNIGLPKILSTGVIHIQYLAEEQCWFDKHSQYPIIGVVRCQKFWSTTVYPIDRYRCQKAKIKHLNTKITTKYQTYRVGLGEKSKIKIKTWALGF